MRKLPHAFLWEHEAIRHIQIEIDVSVLPKLSECLLECPFATPTPVLTLNLDPNFIEFRHHSGLHYACPDQVNTIGSPNGFADLPLLQG